MKKLFAIACMMLMSTAMFAQSNMTARVGVGMSTFTGDDVKDAKSAFAYKIGVDYDYAITDAFSVIPGVEFANKPLKNDEAFDGNVNIFSIQIPIFAAYKFDIAEGMKLAVKAGPYFGFGLFSSKIDMGDGKDYSIFDKEAGEYSRFNAGIVAGLALDLGQYVVGAEFSRGLTKAAKDAKAYGMCYGLTFGYKF